MLFRIASAALAGIESYLVHVEVDISLGLPYWSTVGLPDPSVKESKERVRAVLKNCGFENPPRRVIINLSPADRKKEGPAFDLPIALGFLCDQDVFPEEGLRGLLFLGELALDGALKPARGALAAAIMARREGFRGIVVPKENEREVCLVRGISVYALENIMQVIRLLSEPESTPPSQMTRREFLPRLGHAEDFREIGGQHHVKRALEVATAGGHNILMIGPPGAGKTMMARRLPTILPPMSYEEILEVTQIYSALGLLTGQGAVLDRPFRAPHHSVSQAGLIGGGLHPRPGEVSLAHRGVLFLDKFTEFKKPVLESLRQPLEDGQVTVSRLSSSITFPSVFMLVAAMNPWEDAIISSNHHEDAATACWKSRYYSRLSGPLLDRIDIQVEVPKVEFKDIISPQSGESSKEIRERVIRTRNIQRRRFSGRNMDCNARMGPQEVRQFCRVGERAKDLLESAVNTFGFSARAYVRALKVGRTIADIEEEEGISAVHISEAIQYRMLDRYF